MTTLRRLVSAIAALGLVATGCGGTDPRAPQTRTVLVDYSSDEFASFFLSYFPREIQVRPGDTIVFRQTWTGEAHSVTMGTQADKLGALIEPYYEMFLEGGWDALPQEPPQEILEVEEKLPLMFKDEVEVAQNGAQPCYLKDGLPPEDPDTPCSEEDQVQPPFDGTHQYYNSGFIPYEGPSGNTFTMKLAEDMEPGRHWYYCNLHGPFMSGWIDVKPEGTEIPSQEEVNRQARAEIEQENAAMRETFTRALEGEFEPPEEVAPWLRERGLTERGFFSGYFAGLAAEEVAGVESGINEFIPRDVEVEVGQEVSWVMIFAHTISFDVPEYFPIISVQEDGTVLRNPKLDPPAGGAPEPPEMDEESEGPPEPAVIDGGTYDGEGFWSSGLVSADPFLVYKLRFSKPGSYKYACLIHPPMVGTVEVKSA